MPLLRLTLVLVIASAAAAGEPKWKKHDINPKSVFEAAGVFDIDSDGVPNVVSGELWYKGPDYRVAIRYYGEYPEEIDAWIAANDAEAKRLEAALARERELLA